MLSRRRFLSISAAVSGLALLPAESAISGAPEPVVWRGVVMGGMASMTLVHPDRQFAMDLRKRAIAEIARLEKIFSLFLPGSALSRLNRQGALKDPPLELVELLDFALRLSRESEGAFDPSVQPLFDLYRRYFEAHPNDMAGPAGSDLDEARRLVDYRAIEVTSKKIRLGQRGMGLTLNGVAQGFVTDRVATLLSAAGLENMLLDLGEIRAIGDHPDGRPWQAGIAGPTTARQAVHAIPLMADLPALASSASYGTVFERSNRHHHLFDPKSGRSTPDCGSISVAARTATLADGLSTTFAVLNPDRRAEFMVRFPAVRVFAADINGGVKELAQG